MRAEFETRSSPAAGFGPVDWKVVDEAILRARRLRAEALAEHISHAARLLAGWVAGLLGRIRHARRRRADTVALMTLDNRLLDDIGLKRSDVTAAAYGDVPLRAARPEPVRRPAEVHPLPAREPQPGARAKDLGRAA
jgi:uncharacterized protein YjiS (DUF1127 family)